MCSTAVITLGIGPRSITVNRWTVCSCSRDCSTCLLWVRCSD